MAVPIEIMDNISPIAEPYARFARLYTSQNGDPINDTLRIHFSSVIQNALVCKITPTIGNRLKMFLYKNKPAISINKLCR